MEVKSLLLQWNGNISQKSIDKYRFIQNNFPQNVDSQEFRSTYRSFYRLNGAFLGEEWEQQYFTFLKNKETSLQKILEGLYNFKRKKGDKAYQFSFVTKLIHTIDNDVPIYDSKVARLFNFPIKKKDETKISWCIKTYDSLKVKYAYLLQDNLVQQRIKEFKEKYSAQTISDVKMLDFILWSIGKEQNN